MEPVKPAETEKQALIKTQIEYYLSDENLKSDEFFHSKILADPYGYLDLELIMQCIKVRKAHWTKDDIISGIKTSELIELNKEENKVRRKDNKPLPQLDQTLLQKKRNSDDKKQKKEKAAEIEPVIKIFFFFLTKTIKQPTAMVHILCISPEQKPLAIANPIFTFLKFCVSIIRFSSIAKPTPTEKDAVIISFLSSENTMAKKSTGRALIISSVIGVMLVVKYRSDISDKRSIRPFTSLMKRQQNIPVSINNTTFLDFFSIGSSIRRSGDATQIKSI